MEHCPVDPRKYGVNIVREPQQTFEGDRNAIEAGQPTLPTNSRTPFSVLQTSPPSQHQCEVEGSAHESNENILIELPSTRQLSQSSPADVPVASPVLMANDPQVNTTNISEREAQKKIQKDKRAELQRKKRQQRWREHIARELRCDVTSIDSDEERKYMRRRLERVTTEENAERERRQGLSLEEKRQEDIQASAQHLKRDMETYLGQYARLPYPAFLLQETPQSRNGAKCQLHLCEKRIMPDDYRIAVDPGDRQELLPSCFPESLRVSGH
ncbi:hypothetical protein EN45_044230 [Penicillium chrysogenum]|uniref:Uncharacterized protein n=2 Tax=Penicillium chrysogenum species complex TaxID=254878 RepID=B6GWB2_PENRW|nr:hypothetical protein EN45_044230 [Penicillium chrysogenum]CAP79204.1 hypothetical protein PCH_Pc06g02110 [Penicillium rubens Wisconsin 54-1255]